MSVASQVQQHIIKQTNGFKWKPAMAHISSEILGLRNWFLKYCIVKKLHDKITTDYTLLLGLCKRHFFGDEWKILFVDKL